jgi:hypothetical protein
MPVESLKPEYAAAAAKWTRCRDCRAGQDAVKAKTTEYLPVLEGQTNANDPAYQRYLTRALFYNGVGRTVEALSGAVFRKDVDVTLPAKLVPLTDDLTLTGQSLRAFAMHGIQELLTVGRGGVLVDYNAEADRPYARWYAAESIKNWWAPTEQGKRVVRMVVLQETFEDRSVDEFAPECTPQYRVLTLEGQGLDARLRVRVYRQLKQDGANTRDTTFTVVEDLYPMRRGQAVPFVPFVFLPDVDITEPPLLDLVDVNLSLYRTSADLEHGRHYTALPTVWLVGAPLDTKLPIGSGEAWILNDTAHSKAEMLEFKGQGLGALQEAEESKKKMMAVLGARLLEEQATTQETAYAVAARTSGEMSVLKRLTNRCSEGLTQAVTWVAWWAGFVDAPVVDAKTIAVIVNTAFLPGHLEPQHLTALTTALEKNAISHEVFWHALLRADAVPEGWTRDEEQAAIEKMITEKSERMIKENQALTTEPDPHAPPRPGAPPVDDDVDDDDDAVH